MDTISPSILNFLSQLKENNNRAWFQENKAAFKKEQLQVKHFFNQIEAGLNIHDTIEGQKMFRIYRDVRFSKDKTPYKPHFAVHFTRASKRLRGGYYLRIRPGESFLAGGFWEPNKEDLFRIRKEFEADASEMRTIIRNPVFKKYFGELQGSALKTAPRGFDKNHSNIDLIKKKQFIVVRNFTDAQVCASNFLTDIDNSYKAMRPFFDYMSDVLTTNLNGESIID
ncbi:DUF2461 domain-containing protein [Lutibacter sp.]